MKKILYNYYVMAEFPAFVFLMLGLSSFSQYRFNIPCAVCLMVILLASIVGQIIALKKHAFKKEVLISGICLAFLLCLLYIYSFIVKDVDPDVSRLAAIITVVAYSTYIIVKESKCKSKGIVPNIQIDYQTVKLVLIYLGAMLFWY